jgi:phenylacetate-CoA ligase
MNFYPTFFKNFLFPFYEGILRGRPTVKYLKEFEQNLTLTHEQLKVIQLKKLKNLLAYCDDKVPYYQRLFVQAGISDIRQDIKTLSDFEKIPFLTKDIVRENFNELIPSSLKGKNLKKSTGGSTGQSFYFELDHNSELLRTSVALRGYGWNNAGLGVKTFYLWGTNLNQPSSLGKIKSKFYDAYHNRTTVSSFNMNQNNLDYYIQRINKYKPSVIVGYTMPLYMLAKYINRNNIYTCNIETIITGAEALNEHQRSVIEKAFKCKVYNTYGCREFMLIGAECEKQQGFHMNIDHLVIDTVDDTGSSIIDTDGDLVITDLSNYGMPLLRYVNGDRATITQSKCSCTNPLPILKAISGRKLDVLKARDGAIIPGEFFPHLLKDFPEVLKYQVIQYCLDKLHLNVIISTSFPESSKIKIINIFNELNTSLELVFNVVDDIPLTKTGKHRVTICGIK